MKSKSKKADKNKALASKKEEKSSAIEVKNVPKTTESASKVDVRAAAPIEVLPEVEVPAAIEVKKAAVGTVTKTTITSDERRRLIALAAYYRAERKGFGKTNPVEDWLLAESEVDAMIRREASI